METEKRPRRPDIQIYQPPKKGTVASAMSENSSQSDAKREENKQPSMVFYSSKHRQKEKTSNREHSSKGDTTKKIAEKDDIENNPESYGDNGESNEPKIRDTENKPIGRKQKKHKPPKNKRNQGEEQDSNLEFTDNKPQSNNSSSRGKGSKKSSKMIQDDSDFKYDYNENNRHYSSQHYRDGAYKFSDKNQASFRGRSKTAESGKWKQNQADDYYNDQYRSRSYRGRHNYNDNFDHDYYQSYYDDRYYDSRQGDARRPPFYHSQSMRHQSGYNRRKDDIYSGGEYSNKSDYRGRSQQGKSTGRQDVRNRFSDDNDDQRHSPHPRDNTRRQDSSYNKQFKNNRGQPRNYEQKFSSNQYQTKHDDNVNDRVQAGASAQRKVKTEQQPFLDTTPSSQKVEPNLSDEFTKNKEKGHNRPHNSNSRDFSDTRLFNPYENENKMKDKRSHNQSTSSTSSLNTGEASRHHGGLLYIPTSISITSTSSPAPSPAENPKPIMSQQYRNSRGGYHHPQYQRDMEHNKPVVVVRPNVLQERSFQMIPVRHMFYPYCESGFYPIKDKCPPPNSQIANLLNELNHYQNQLATMTHTTLCGSFKEFSIHLDSLRQKILNNYEQILLSDVEFCNKANIEQDMWKNAFYNIIEIYRKWLDNPVSTGIHLHMESDVETLSSEIRACLLQILSTGSNFLEQLIGKLEATFKVELSLIFQCGFLPANTRSRTQKLVYLTTQKLMLFLGDLARYKELVQNTNNYGKARSCYLKALLLAPKNGRPYNQLAVLAIYTQRRLDAMYYYMRTLAASNPFLTATQHLASLFEDVRRKAEEVLRQQQDSLKRRRKELHRSQMYHDKSSGARVEVWINSTDGSKQSSLVERDISEKDDYVNMPFIELIKRFNLSFLHAHGMLFTKIGMENFPEVCSSVLLSLEALLNVSPCPFSESHLCELLIVDMFNSDRAASLNQDQHSLHTTGNTMRSLHQEQACRLALDVFALICRKCAELIRQSHYQFPLSNEVRCLLPSIRLWCDWMVNHPEHWNPPPSQRDPLFGPHLDDWAIVADMCTQAAIILSNIDGQEPDYFTDRPTKLTDVASTVLLEENIISGFTPMLDQTPQIIYYPESTDKQCVEDVIRLSKIQLFGDYLLGIEPQMLDFVVSEKKYISLVHRETSERLADIRQQQIEEEQARKAEKEKKDTLFDDKSLEGKNWADIEDPVTPPEPEHDASIAELRERRSNLQRSLMEEKKLTEKLQSALELEASGHRSLQMQVTPVFLIPDTNCYIDCLTGIKSLLRCRRYTVIVPILVINELTYLAKNESDSDNNQLVQQRASVAMQFLEEEFERRPNNYLKAITGKGTLLETITFRHEEFEREGRNNDDVILSCCQHFCQDKARDFMPKSRDEPIILKREVVLLTSDRNLRLKAVTSNVPVRTIYAFLKWARLTVGV